MFEINTDDIPNVAIEMTFFEGRLVYDKNDSGITNQKKNIILEQNFPNPFNSITTIQFSLSKGQKIKLSVLDFQGKEVAIITEGYVTAGEHSIKFNGSKLTSGQYFYKIETEDFSKTKKMILLK